jgi:8-oxo-dGTP diphosphatase
MEMPKHYCYSHPRPAMTVDLACFAETAGGTQVLLIRRRRDPFAGRWALPGGFVDEFEPLEAAAARELEEETGLTGVSLDQFRAYGDPGRDPRGHTVTIVFIGRLTAPAEIAGADDAEDAAWFPVDQLPPLAFDHDRIVPEAVARYRSGELRVARREVRE